MNMNVANEIEQYIEIWFEENWQEICSHRPTAEKMWLEGIHATVLIKEILNRMKETDDLEKRKAYFFLMYKTYLSKVASNDKMFLKVLAEFKDFWAVEDSNKKLILDLGPVANDISKEIENWKLTRAS